MPYSDPAIATAVHAAGIAGLSLRPYYTNPATTLRPGSGDAPRLFVAGWNPGGPSSTSSSTPARPICTPLGVPAPPPPAHANDWCAYLDDAPWPSRFRPNLEALAVAVLGGSQVLRQAFCSNAFFMRWDARPRLPARRRLWDACHPWHAKWLATMGSARILCLGRGEAALASPYACFRDLLQRAPFAGFRQLAPLVMVAGYPVTSCEATLSGQLVRIVGVHHPSWRGPPRSNPSWPATATRIRTLLT